MPLILALRRQYDLCAFKTSLVYIQDPIANNVQQIARAERASCPFHEGAARGGCLWTITWALTSHWIQQHLKLGLPLGEPSEINACCARVYSICCSKVKTVGDSQHKDLLAELIKVCLARTWKDKSSGLQVLLYLGECSSGDACNLSAGK